MYHRVRIKKLPKAKTGQQVNGSLAVQSAAMGGADIDQYIGKPGMKVKDTLTKVPRDEANLEAEGGETAYGDINGDGFTEHYKIEGPRHSEGGVPLDLPDGTFIFSDTRAMKIKDCEIIKMFNKSCKKSYTPAELAKSININHYRKLLQDPETDGMTRKTAELMLRNYNMKLGALALAQEALKGFPQGIPEVSIPYMKAMGIKPEDILPEDPQQQLAQQMPPQQMPSGEPIAMSPEMMQQMGAPQEMMPLQEQPMMVYGGYMKTGGTSGSCPKGTFWSEYAQDCLTEKEILQNYRDVAYQYGTNQKNLRGESLNNDFQQAYKDYMTTQSAYDQTLNPNSFPATTYHIGQGLRNTLNSMFGTSYKKGGEANQQPMMTYGGYPMAMYGMEMGGYDLPFAAYGMTMGANPNNYMGRTPSYAEGGYLPKAQNGYNFPTTFVTDVFGNPIQVAGTDELKDVETIQRSRPGQGYGKQVQDVDKFMEVHSWYFKNKSEAEKESFRKAARAGKKSPIITNFQKSYNNLLRGEAKKKGLNETEINEIINQAGFSDKGVQKLDGKFGAFTSSRPFFDFEKETVTEVEPTTTKTKTETEEDIQVPTSTQLPFVEPNVPWSTQANREANFLQKAKWSREKQYPWGAPLEAQVPEPTYMDPRATLNAQAALARTSQEAAAQFAGPSSGARQAQAMANLATQGAKTIADVYNYNVGVANQFAPIQANVLANTEKYNKDLARNLYDLTNLMKDQYRKEGLAIDQNLVAVANAADDAAQRIEKLNALNPNYGIYGSDRDLVFKQGKPLTPEKPTDVFALADRLQEDYNLEGDEAIKEARLLSGMYSGTGAGVDLDAVLDQYSKNGGPVFAYTTFPFIM